MVIEKKLLDKWKALRSPDDSGKIAMMAETTPETVQNAFRNGKTNDKVFEAMAKFYKEKAEMIAQYL